MSYTVNSLEEMPNALSYLIKTVEELQSTVKALQHKQASDSPKWIVFAWLSLQTSLCDNCCHCHSCMGSGSLTQQHEI